ncbi:hypothetical protein EGR_09949 [Echinococcus granulosus]|uniref:Uncharacterized protein n=1 Tax=Echinococcus granulosus TaxID=6210 RepID=W6U3M8_ECHGR|nr:hypothetical protein EGR_09949 [Echinococcus granulosus]EUB55186.1 hypothetical protein EGR_09949 [Echinococcus granulosus]
MSVIVSWCMEFSHLPIEEFSLIKLGFPLDLACIRIEEFSIFCMPIHPHILNEILLFYIFIAILLLEGVICCNVMWMHEGFVSTSTTIFFIRDRKKGCIVSLKKCSRSSLMKQCPKGRNFCKHVCQGDVSEGNGKCTDKVSLINNLQIAIVMGSPQLCLNDTRKIEKSECTVLILYTKDGVSCTIPPKRLVCVDHNSSRRFFAEKLTVNVLENNQRAKTKSRESHILLTNKEAKTRRRMNLGGFLNFLSLKQTNLRQRVGYEGLACITAYLDERLQSKQNGVSGSYNSPHKCEAPLTEKMVNVWKSKGSNFNCLKDNDEISHKLLKPWVRFIYQVATLVRCLNQLNVVKNCIKNTNSLANQRMSSLPQFKLSFQRTNKQNGCQMYLLYSTLCYTKDCFNLTNLHDLSKQLPFTA